MPNNAATLNGKLDTQVNDAADTVWTSAEKDDVIKWAVADLWPRLSHENDPTLDDFSLVAETYFYDSPNLALGAVSKLYMVDDSGIEVGWLPIGSWEVIGSPPDTLQLHISQAIVTAYPGATIRVYGYEKYSVSADPYVPDDLIPLVLATARAELYRRLVGDRARFQVWLSRQQTQNISVNEAIQMVNDADHEADKLRSRQKMWQKPVPARV